LVWNNKIPATHEIFYKKSPNKGNIYQQKSSYHFGATRRRGMKKSFTGNILVPEADRKNSVSVI
jgi:hypothetical protein